MVLVMAYRLAFPPPDVTGAPDATLPDGTVADTVLMTNHVLADDTLIYAHGGEPEVAIAEADGDPAARMVHWPAMESVIAGRFALLTPARGAPVITREAVICRGGPYDGYTFSSLIGYALLGVKSRVGPVAVSEYRRTYEASDGDAVFEFVAREAPYA